MGAFNSIHERLKEFSEAEEENEAECSTPQRALRHKCLAGVDPRSPTEEINRTPIIVDGTPNVQMSKGIKSRISSELESPIDPRSPSSEFTRTPLTFGQASSGSSSTPLRPPMHFVSPSYVKGEDLEAEGESKQNVSTENQLCNTSNQSSSFSDSDIITTMEESLEKSSDTAPLLDGTDNLSKLSIQDERNSSTSGQETDDSFLPHSKPKCRPVNRILGHNTSMPAIKVRSALTAVENSPRISKFPKKNITSSLSKTDSNHMNSPVSIDKENVCH